jgi:hypothetical protein
MTHDGFEQKKVTIEVLAWTYQGLALHVANPWVNEDELSVGFSWTITHAKSGYRVIGKIGSKDEAKALMKQLAPLTSWEALTVKEIHGNENLHQQVKRLAMTVERVVSETIDDDEGGDA